MLVHCIPFPELSARLPHSLPAPALEYQSITFHEPNEPEEVLMSSSRNMDHRQHSESTAVTEVHSSGAGLTHSASITLGKHGRDDSTEDDPQPEKCCHHLCQKCGKVDCADGASRKYCKYPCQDCGKHECHGRNSQHPKKSCSIGWQLHHKVLKH